MLPRHSLYEGEEGGGGGRHYSQRANLILQAKYLFTKKAIEFYHSIYIFGWIRY